MLRVRALHLPVLARRRHWLISAGVIALLAIIGVGFAASPSSASSASLSFPAAQGLLSAPAGTISDASSITGQAVQFNAPTPDSAGFIHPGVLVDQAQLNFVKTQLASGANPWTNALANVNTTYTNPSYTPGPVATIDCTANNAGCNKLISDGIAAYTQALLYVYSSAPDRAKYADEAIRIMNAWSSALTGSNGNQSRLELAWSAEVFPRAAEIISYNFTPGYGDPTFNAAAFSAMLNNVYVPSISAGDPYSNGNWELAMADGLMSMGVFTDNRATFNTGVSLWQGRVPAYIYLSSDNGGNGQPIAPPGGKYNTPALLNCYWLGAGTPTTCNTPAGFTYQNGMTQETCRDISHPILGLDALVNGAETARLQGVDLYGQQAARISAAYEYTAQFDNQYLNTGTWPSSPCGGRPGAFTGQSGDGTGGSGYLYGWETAYNEFANRLGMAMPNTTQMINRVRPTGGVNNSAWETLVNAGPTAPAGCTLPDDRLGTDIIKVTVPTDGTYQLWSRLKPTDSSNTSYTVQVDNGCPVNVGGSSLAAGEWSWVNSQNGNPTSSTSLSLTAGSHTFILTGSSPGLSIDSILLATDPTCVPVDTGANCLAPIPPPPTDITPPTTILTSPVTGAVLTGSAALTATATDDTAVARVDFLSNGAVIDSTTTPPYSFTWDTTVVPNGTYSLESQAYDEAGNTTISLPIAVTVQNVDITPPSAPTSFSAIYTSSTTAALSWTAASDNIGVSKYVIYRNGNQLTTTPYTTYKDNSLVTVTAYTYSVAAEDAAGNIGPSSNTASFTTPDGTAPTKPTTLTATLTAANSVTLTWKAATDNVGVTNYTITRNGSGITALAGTVLSYTDTADIPGISNSYTVLAQDAAGNVSSASNTASITTRDTIPPSAPTGLSGNSGSPSSITLSWTAATDNIGVTGYKVFRGSTQVGTTTTATTYTDSGLSASTAYTYTVAAADAAGNVSASSLSTTVNTLAGPDVTPPTPPTNVTAQATSANTATVGWTAATDNIGVTGYKVYRNGALIGATTSLTYSDSGLTTATTYSYTVYAFDAAGNASAISTAAVVTTPDNVPPSAPTSLAAKATGGTTVTLTWTASTDNVGITSYQVYRGGIQIGTSSTPSYADSGLTNTTAYSYNVYALDAAGNVSTVSNTATVTTLDTTAPTAPTGVTATALTSSTASVIWAAATDNVGVTKYLVYRGAAQVGTSTTLSYNDSGLSGSTAYTYTVYAQDAAGNTSPASLGSTITTPAPTDVTPPSAPTSLKATAPSSTTTSLSWTAATDNVGVTGYKVYRGGVQIGTSTTPTYSDSGLTAGTSYSYVVYALDAAGNVSAASNTATVTTPATVPGAPTAASAIAGDTTATVSFVAPSSNGGATITSYKVTASPGGLTATGTISPITVSGLTNGTSYSFTVVAINSVGSSVASLPSNSVAPVHPATVPGAPTSVIAVASNTSAKLTFTAPASNGGATITGYTVTSTPGNVTASGASSPITITGLVNGTSYTFTVKATNSVGNSAASLPSNAVSPAVQLLPDPGFESSNGGWIAFNVGTLTRVNTPVHTGLSALKVAAPSSGSALVGLTQNSVVSNSVAGKVYTAFCYVEPTSANLNVQIRFLEYTQNFGSSIHLQTTLINNLPVNTWTLVQVSSTAVHSGERMVPQIYSTNETTATGSLIYDDCSVTSN